MLSCRAKWKPAGYEVRFDGGLAVIVHFEGRIVAIAWQQMGDVERHLFAKDCNELLHRDVIYTSEYNSSFI